MRVLAPPSDEILAASLKYNLPKDVLIKGEQPDIDHYLSDPKSELFLGSKRIQSNNYLGARDIGLLPSKVMRRHNWFERRMLRAHGIDPKTPEVPQEVKRAALMIAREFEKDIGILGGHDFICDREKGWCYLEANGHRSGPITYMKARGLKYQEPAQAEVEHTYDLFKKYGAVSKDDDKKRVFADLKRHLKSLQQEKYMLEAKDEVLGWRVSNSF